MEYSKEVYCAESYLPSWCVVGAASVRVSNELGAGRPDPARLAAKCAMAVAVTLMTCIAVILLSLHSILPFILTSDPLVVRGTQQVLPILAALLIGDGLNAVLAGVIRGCGRQAIGNPPCHACCMPDVHQNMADCHAMSAHAAPITPSMSRSNYL